MNEYHIRHIIEKAQENGWHSEYRLLMIGEYKKNMVGSIARFSAEVSEGVSEVFSREVATILLSKDFAKCYFGGDFDEWSDHLINAVFSDDMVGYYYEFR